MRHLISLAEMSDGALRDVISRCRQYSRSQVRAENQLCGRVVGIYFRTSSTRTRTAFSTGALRLGARIVSYGPRDLQENTGEAIEDTARVVSLKLEAVGARTARRPGERRAPPAQDRMAVVNPHGADGHPNQARAHLTTILSPFGVMDDLPAQRGEEVAGEVIDGASSIVFEQARNKLHSAMAVLEWCMCES